MAQATIEGTPLQISGVNTSEKENIEIHLGMENGILPFTAFGFPRSNEFIIRKTKVALQALGYYTPNIGLSGDHKLWQLNIVPGDPVRLKTVDVQLIGDGKNVSQLKALIKAHPFRINERLDHGLYSNFKTQLISLASEIGFFDGYFVKKELSVNVQSLTADIQLLFDTQKRYVIGNIQVDGSKLSDAFLQRFLHIKIGDSYTQQAVVQTQQAFNRSGYFSAISFEQKLEPNTGQIDLFLHLSDITKYEFKTSLGFRTDSGAIVSAAWQDRQFNERGHQYLVSTELSNIEKSTSFQYKLPTDGEKNEMLYRYSYRIKSDELAESKLSSVEARMLLFHDDYWSSQTAVTLANENVNSNASINSNLNYIIPSWRVNYYSVIDPFKAKTGWRWQNEVRGSSDAFSDPDISFVQVEQKIKSILALSDRWRLLLRAQLGYTHMDIDSFNQNMPSNYRFFAGGDVSVRGYDYQTLSPQNNDGIILGGKHLMTASVELDWLINDNFRAAIFSDRGSAFNEFSSMNQRKSIGAGIRWITFVGSIRLDYAKALNEPEGWRWHITVGPDL